MTLDFVQIRAGTERRSPNEPSRSAASNRCGVPAAIGLSRSVTAVVITSLVSPSTRRMLVLSKPKQAFSVMAPIGHLRKRY